MPRLEPYDRTITSSSTRTERKPILGGGRMWVKLADGDDEYVIITHQPFGMTYYIGEDNPATFNEKDIRHKTVALGQLNSRAFAHRFRDLQTPMWVYTWTDNIPHVIRGSLLTVVNKLYIKGAIN